MEKIFKVKCNELVNIGERFTQYKKELCPSSLERLPETYDEVKWILGICDDNEELLEDSISINNLAQPDDVLVNEFNLHELHNRRGQKTIEIPKKAMRLKCVRKKFEDQTTGNSANTEQSARKYNRYRYIEDKYDNTVGDCDLKPFDEVLITVRVYEPFVYCRGFSTMRKPRLSQEFSVLGRQYLTDLRDKIFCSCQFGPFNDISNDFSSIAKTGTGLETSPSKASDSGFFFITDTFYTDMRTPGTDYSTEIRDWMKRQKDIGPHRLAVMENTRFENLNVRLGFPQVYRHYGICEHVIAISDIRLLAPDDSLKSSDYPMLRCVTSSKMCLCMACGVIEASFVVKNSTTHVQDPSYLCKNCFISLHYIDGKKIGNFQAFRYYGNRPILN